MQYTLIEKAFRVFLLVTSEEFRKVLEKEIIKLYVFALSTKNPFDDWFIEILSKILIIDLKGKRQMEREKSIKGGD